MKKMNLLVVLGVFCVGFAMASPADTQLFFHIEGKEKIIAALEILNRTTASPSGLKCGDAVVQDVMSCIATGDPLSHLAIAYAFNTDGSMREIGISPYTSSNGCASFVGCKSLTAVDAAKLLSLKTN